MTALLPKISEYPPDIPQVEKCVLGVEYCCCCHVSGCWGMIKAINTR